MSDAVAPLNGAQSRGALAKVQALPLHGMITVRGDLSDAKVKKVVKTASGVAIPPQGQLSGTASGGAAWMSPDEVLVLCPYADVPAKLTAMQSALGDAFAMAVDVSDARAVVQVSGPGAREVMAKLAPVDLHPDAFTPGMFRRTRLAQVPAAFWMADDETFCVICFRSQAQYVFDLLITAALPE